MKSKHPFEPFIPAGATKLILGTIPPARFCKNLNMELFEDDVDFYYGSKDNAFWDLFGEVFDVYFEKSNTAKAINERKSFLEKKKIGITDIISECFRENESSLDDKLDVISRKELGKLLIDHPSISTLIYTSEFVKKQVNKLLGGYHQINKENKKKQTVKINGRVYQVRILYSPSPSGLRRLGVDGSAKRLNQWKIFLTDEAKK